jgi:hypothetical protein
VLHRGLEVLADGEEIHGGAAEVVHHLQHLAPPFAEADHQAGLGEDGGVEFLHPVQQPQRVEVARAGPDGEVEARHRFQVVVEHVRARLDHHLQRAVLAEEVGVSTSIVVPGAAARMARIGRAKCSAPPSGRSSRSTLVTTTWRRPSVATASATRRGSSASSARGMPVATLQKEQARVQVSPMIIMVAWRCDQHSPMFGQAASSHTVTKRLSRISARVSW